MRARAGRQGRAAGTRARKCACQQDAPSLAASAAKTGVVQVCRGSAVRTGLGQDSSMSTARGRGEFVPAASATARATHGAATAAMRRACLCLPNVPLHVLPYVLQRQLRSRPQFDWRFAVGQGLPGFDWQGPAPRLRPAVGSAARAGVREAGLTVLCLSVIGQRDFELPAREAHCQRAHAQVPAVRQRHCSHRA